jgi:hypothetical protein
VTAQWSDSDISQKHNCTETSQLARNRHFTNNSVVSSTWACGPPNGLVSPVRNRRKLPIFGVAPSQTHTRARINISTVCRIAQTAD